MNLKEFRATKGMYPSFVAKELNVTVRHFNRIENGEGYMTKERAKKLSKIYNTQLSEIVEMYGGKIHE